MRFHGNYAIYYVATATEVVIVRVLHGARDAAAIAEQGGRLDDRVAFTRRGDAGRLGAAVQRLADYDFEVTAMNDQSPLSDNRKQATTGQTDEPLLQALSASLWADLAVIPEFYTAKPLLAHYTSIHTLEAILRNKEFWFSNPLYMNDLEEVRFGISEGLPAFMASQALEAACQTPQRAALLRQHFDFFFRMFDREHILDTYVFCLSEHDPGDGDGLLSMWRGYAANGNGAAIVFDTAQFTRREDTPLILARVVYASTEDRRKWIADKIEALAHQISALAIPDDKLHIPAFAFFERLKMFALFTKHPGFREEREWRAVYLPERDLTKSFVHLIDYVIGPRGIEGKLKLKIAPMAGFIEDDISLDKIIHRIILGPTISSPLARAAVKKMLDRHAPQLKDRIAASTIPFRAG